MMEELQRQIDELKARLASFNLSSAIPLGVDQAFRERFNIPRVVQKTIDFAGVTFQSANTVTVDFPGARVGDLVLVTPPGAVVENDFGIGFCYGFVSSLGVVSIRFVNPYDAATGTTLNPSSGSYTIAIIRK